MYVSKINQSGQDILAHMHVGWLVKWPGMHIQYEAVRLAMHNRCQAQS
jgi:hypothetical protein